MLSCPNKSLAVWSPRSSEVSSAVFARRRSDDDAPPDDSSKPQKKSRFKYKFGEPKPDAQILELPNAWVKSVLGFRQLSMCGLAKAQAEWRLVCRALNLRRMANMMYMQGKEKQKTA